MSIISASSVNYAVYYNKLLSVVITARDGTWLYFQLECIGNALHLVPVSDSASMRLAALTAVSSLSLLRSRDEISLLSLTDSHVLLAAITRDPTPEIVLLLWDLQYSVLLASHSIPIPSNLSYSKDTGIQLDLAATTSSHALLVLSQHPSSSRGKIADTMTSTTTTSPRSSVLVVPLVVPATSTIANAMGRANDGLKWLAPSSKLLANSSSPDDDGDNEAGREKLLHTMRTALEQNNGKMASDEFFKWERDEFARLKATDQGGKTTGGAKVRKKRDLSLL